MLQCIATAEAVLAIQLIELEVLNALLTENNAVLARLVDLCVRQFVKSVTAPAPQLSPEPLMRVRERAQGGAQG